MRVTILPYFVILNKAHRAVVSLMAKGCIVEQVLPLRCSCFYYPTIVMFMQLKCIGLIS